MTLNQLIGNWSFERSISGQGQMTGTAVFSERPDGLLDYREVGQLQIANGSFAFNRSYLYQVRADGFEVFFDEAPPRLFQRVDLTETAHGLTGSGHHLCPPDIYDSRYEFHLPNRFLIVHAVDGPRKAYVIRTEFKRQD
ncbi:DUF6314 family protein [Devosia sp. 2618]|uniref:DUF6314 family protein n=1 Tax=Devosia sp. 2618 TaxID=3156454 RepID=UPI0033937371